MTTYKIRLTTGETLSVEGDGYNIDHRTGTVGVFVKITEAYRVAQHIDRLSIAGGRWEWIMEAELLPVE